MEKIKLFCVSLGCDKNLVDTEKMLGVAGGLGVSFTDDETEADAILINTCCFIGDAKEESVNTILEMARYKDGKIQWSDSAGVFSGHGSQNFKYGKGRHPVFLEAPSLRRLLCHAGRG